MAKKDINEPVLFIVERGRGNRGFLVSALDDTSNPFPCSDATQIGESILEILNDPNQARFDKKQFSTQQQEPDEEDDEGDDDGGEEDPYAKLDSTERLIFQAGEFILGKARQASNSYRKTGKSKKKKKSKKSKS